VRGRKPTATTLLVAAVLLGVWAAAFRRGLTVLLVVVPLTAVPVVLLVSRWDARRVFHRAAAAQAPDTGAPQPGETFVCTSTYAKALGAALPLVAGVAAIAASVVAPEPAWVLGFVAALVLFLLLRRAWRIALVLGVDGVVITNVYRTHNVRWEDVGRIYAGADAVSFVVTGRRVAVEALATRGKVRDPALVRQLRRFAEPHGVELDPELMRAG